MPVTPGMKGEGYYDRHSSAQAALIQLLHGWLEQAVAELPLLSGEAPLTLLDLGSSEGKNAIGSMRLLTSALRHFTRQPIQTVYNDLPTSNFNRLFANLHDPEQAGGFPPDVFASATAGSFYIPVLPPGTVHLATCCNALLWLDRLPDVAIPDFICYRRASPPRPGLHVPTDIEQAFQTQADSDLVRFLECRAGELVAGGKLLLAAPGDDSKGRCVDGLYDVLNDALLDLVAEKIIPRERYERVTIPVYFRTLEETTAPLTRPGSPVQGAFSVDRAEVLEVPTPFVVEFQRTGNVAEYADRFQRLLAGLQRADPPCGPGRPRVRSERPGCGLPASPGETQGGAGAIPVPLCADCCVAHQDGSVLTRPETRPERTGFPVARCPVSPGHLATGKPVLLCSYLG